MMQRAFEGELKPLLEQLKKLEGIPVPDFGPLDDWAANRNAQMQRRARRAEGTPTPPLPQRPPFPDLLTTCHDCMLASVATACAVHACCCRLVCYTCLLLLPV